MKTTFNCRAIIASAKSEIRGSMRIAPISNWPLKIAANDLWSSNLGDELIDLS